MVHLLVCYLGDRLVTFCISFCVGRTNANAGKYLSCLKRRVALLIASVGNGFLDFPGGSVVAVHCEFCKYAVADTFLEHIDSRVSVRVVSSLEKDYDNYVCSAVRSLRLGLGGTCSVYTTVLALKLPYMEFQGIP
jgi:hypothetical protein